MRNRYDMQLHLLDTQLTHMGELCETAIAKVTQALKEGNTEQAKIVIKEDEEIDQIEKDIERLCLKLLLQQQPVARDLRRISAALKMITDMERIGDQTSDIAEIIISSKWEKMDENLDKLTAMATGVSKMVRNSVTAYVEKDLELARTVMNDDDEIDDYFDEIRDQIIYEIAFIESALDDPEHISLDGYGEKLLGVVLSVKKKLEKLIRSSSNGRVVSEGVKTVILGKPNAGKSSLMNVLVGEDRAIVTDVAGTTRDILEEHIYLQGISLNVVDTAGIRDTEDVVEKIGVSRAMEEAKKADLIIYVVDGSRELDENDYQIMDFINDRKAVVLLNKSDLEPVVSAKEVEERSGHKVIGISAKEETGIDLLEEEIKALFYEGEIDFNDQVMITNVRHVRALKDAFESMSMVEKSIENGMPEDFYSIDLMDAYEKLGLIVGESVEDDLVNEIFSKFCMGK